MARPQKNNADYFSHDNDMRNDEKIKAVRRKFRHEGYSVWNMMLEKLCKAADFTLEYSDANIELWAGDFEIEPEVLKEMIEYFLKVDLLLLQEKLIFSETMINRFNGLLSKRKRQKEWLSTTKKPETEVIDVDNPQSKVKKKKVKKSKVNIILKDDCLKFIDKYGNDMIESFLEYWEESDGQGKQRWQLEETWETSRRLSRWKKNNFGSKQVQKVNGAGGLIL